MGNKNNQDTWLRNISVCCLFITMCISILSFAGWVMGSATITGISQNYKPVSPITALCLLILSISFIIYTKKPENRERRIIVLACASFVLLISLVIIICYYSGIRLEAEHLAFAVQPFPAGHMAPLTAANLIAVCLGILFLTFPSYKRPLYNDIAAFCEISAIISGLIVLLGYLYETPLLCGEHSVPVSILGAASLLFIGTGVLAAAWPDTLPAKLFTGPSIRSQLTRTFLPVIIVAVFINDALVRLLSSLIRINPALFRALIAAASAIIVGIIIAKLAKSIGVQIDQTHTDLIKKDEELSQSNKLFAMITENINDAIWLLDADLEKIIYVSPAYEMIWNKSKPYLLDNPLTLFDNVHPEDKEKVRSYYLIQKSGEQTHVEFRIMLEDGSVKWVEGNGYPVRNASGQVIYNVAIIKDVTERKHAEVNLRSERDFSDAALNSLPAVFYLFDNTGRFLRWNKNVEIVTGYSEEEIEKMHPLDFIADYDKALVAEKIEMVFRKGFADVEAHYILKSGKIIPYYFTAIPFNLKGIPCLIGIGIDITEQKQNALALQKEKETAQKYIDIAGVMLIAVNLDLEIILANKKTCAVLGYEEKELIGRNSIEAFIPEDKRHEYEIFIKKLIAGEMEISEAKKLKGDIVTKQGKQRVIEWSDILLKDDSGKIIGILTSGEDVTERIEIQNMLIQAKNEWEETFDTINDAITIHDDKNNIIRANKAALDLLRISFSDIKKFKCFQLYHGYDSPLPDCPCCNVLKTGEISFQRIFEPHIDRHIEIKAIPRFGQNNKVIGAVHIVRDISDQVKAEEQQHILQNQLMHMQKMESIGRLAGGVAHDFNNILSGILGFCELALLDISKDDPLRERLELIMGLAEKAGALTHQLLAFSRKQKLVMKDINLNNVVTEVAKMLKRIIGEDITLELRTSETSKDVLADQSQMEQVLLNLAVNSRDAMPNGGVLTIEVSDEILAENAIQNNEGADQGEYVKLTISDTGCGMSSNVIENVFEPFYTTKEGGKGTGLGLATVYGIIKQHNGHIDVTSKINEGSVFKIYLPVSRENKNKKLSERLIIQTTGGNETILVVDDEPIMLSIIEKALKPLGYRLLIANSPEEGIKINETYNGIIDLLLTDIIMPHMNGKQLSDIIVNRRPGIKVVFMSGYPADQRTVEENKLYLQETFES